jgi:hypothetical protein
VPDTTGTVQRSRGIICKRLAPFTLEHSGHSCAASLSHLRCSPTRPYGPHPSLRSAHSLAALPPSAIHYVHSRRYTPHMITYAVALVFAHPSDGPHCSRKHNHILSKDLLSLWALLSLRKDTSVHLTAHAHLQCPMCFHSPSYLDQLTTRANDTTGCRIHPPSSLVPTLKANRQSTLPTQAKTIHPSCAPCASSTRHTGPSIRFLLRCRCRRRRPSSGRTRRCL